MTEEERRNLATKASRHMDKLLSFCRETFDGPMEAVFTLLVTARALTKLLGGPSLAAFVEIVESTVSTEDKPS